MQDYESAVFISYAWGGDSEEIVNQIDRALQRRGIKAIRDKQKVAYKDSISQFMERIGRGNYVIVVISDRYLRSPNCMFELVEIADGKQFHDRIFPVVLADADIYNPVKRLGYIKYWEEKRAELVAAMKDVDPANLQGIREDMDLYDRIRDRFSELTSILSDMNTLNPEFHTDSDFSELYGALKRRMESDGLPPRSRNKPKKAPAKKRPRAEATRSSAEPEGLPTTREVVAGPISEKEADRDTETEDALETQSARHLQAALTANLLANNRAQSVFNDRAQGADQLGIRDEMEALAQTLLLRDVDPPIVVGVMGGGGSAKSFVMYLLHGHIQSIRAQRVKKGWSDGDEKDARTPVFVGHVYQIHFNAWTYARSNLWVSLMDTIFSGLNRQMQLERLLAHREFSPEKPPSKEQFHASMLAGGNEFKKIYMDNPQLGQDKDLEKWRKNLEYWSQHLLRGSLLWNILRGQQVELLEELKDKEEQLNQLRARRAQFEKDRKLHEITARDLEPTTRRAYFQSIKSFMLAFLSDQLSTAAKDELKKQDVKEEDVQKYLEEAKGLWGGIKTVVTAFRRSKLYLIWTLIFFALIFALPYVWSTYDLEFVQFQVAKNIIWFLTLLPTLAVIAPWIKKSIEASVEAKKILEGAYVAQQARYAEEIANSTNIPLPQKISALQTDISRGSIAAYDSLIALLETQTEEQRQKIGPAAKYSNLMEFVQARLDAATSENQQRLINQVRQDFDELTFSLVDNASPDVFPRGRPRVILYIDDLDRCLPPRVVEILEAVQLLLNTKLFIVILGLDPRYVTRVLEKEMPQHRGDPSGVDYIEKIIQIPYRVRPIEKDNLLPYLANQMDIETVRESAIRSTLFVRNEQSQEEPIPTPTAEVVQPPPAMIQELVTPSPVETHGPEILATMLQFKQEDLDDLTLCCKKIVLTPRSIKRLITVFRLMKIFWFQADRNAGITERDRPRAVKQAAMSLLALASAYPEVMHEVFLYLDSLYSQGLVQTDLFTALNSIKLPPGSANELSWQLQKYKADVSALKAIAGNGQESFGQLALEDFKLSTFNIVRSFSFVGDPVFLLDR
jgi:hypothetical protein